MKKVCPDCNGSGVYLGLGFMPPEKCLRCDGAGMVFDLDAVAPPCIEDTKTTTPKDIFQLGYSCSVRGVDHVKLWCYVRKVSAPGFGEIIQFSKLSCWSHVSYVDPGPGIVGSSPWTLAAAIPNRQKSQLMQKIQIWNPWLRGSKDIQLDDDFFRELPDA